MQKRLLVALSLCPTVQVALPPCQTVQIASPLCQTVQVEGSPLLQSEDVGVWSAGVRPDRDVYGELTPARHGPHPQALRKLQLEALRKAAVLFKLIQREEVLLTPSRWRYCMQELREMSRMLTILGIKLSRYARCLHL